VKEQDVIEHLETVNRIAAEYLKGKNESEISKELSIPRPRVVSYLSEWKNTAANSEAVRSRAREALAGADVHYTEIIKGAYGIIQEASEAHAMENLSLSAKLSHTETALKMVADLEARRISMLQQAGLLENRELADQLVEQEKQQEAIMKIIKDVIGNCPVCKPRVLQRLAGIGKQPITIVEGQVD